MQHFGVFFVVSFNKLLNNALTLRPTDRNHQNYIYVKGEYYGKNKALFETRECGMIKKWHD